MVQKKVGIRPKTNSTTLNFSLLVSENLAVKLTKLKTF